MTLTFLQCTHNKDYMYVVPWFGSWQRVPIVLSRTIKHTRITAYVLSMVKHCTCIQLECQSFLKVRTIIADGGKQDRGTNIVTVP